MESAQSSLLNLSVAQLRKAAAIKEQIEALTAELAAILTGAHSAATADPAPGKRGMSAAGRARVAAAARSRWAKIREAKGTESTPAPAKKRTMSPAARKKIADAARARWAKVRAAKAKAA